MPFSPDTEVELTLDPLSLRVEQGGQAITLARRELSARIVNRLDFDHRPGRRSAGLFGLNISQRLGEARLARSLCIDSTQGPLWFRTAEDATLVAALPQIEPRPITSHRRGWRALINVGILVLIALIITMIGARLTIH